ncbi:glycosyl transferase group 1 [Bacillus methanolicus PB1]|uniref:Glycosyl transferase group 1 n=1 Tax=Bacillus methanolicus PB1 TaxID=997296 RepID=I3E4A0_BACMT|nr:glycosyltransferase family 4 protein [Bacillus methanolicus]EIJ81321.1 glycosyl transferase group 1 [Bacillus methanolicus PB1]
MEKGVNLIGYARAEFGLGESCRLAAKSLNSVGIPFCIVNFPNCPSRQNDLTWQHKEVNEPIYKTNIFFINADQLYYNYRKNKIKRIWFLHRYNIGYWHWELPEFPTKWTKSVHLVNEIWVPSNFTFQSISKKISKPVVTIPHGITVETPLHFNRNDFGLPENRFLFLTMYDIHSTSFRKNPIGVIHAFKQAFNKEDHSVGLVVKINNASHAPQEVEMLKQKIAGYQNIFLIDKVLSRQEVDGLMNSIDCFVSLHRSEGFGLPLAEAMFLGKPVIATNWSGNIDFINEQNACVVDFTLKKIGQNYGPYTANQYWAEPYIDQAANFMKKLVEDKEYGNRIGKLGKETIMNQYSPQMVGNMYKSRLQQLGLL